MGGGGSKEKYGEGDADKNHPDNKPMKGDEWVDLREKKRGCTDCLCLLLLIVCWFVMSVLGLVVTGVIKDSRLTKGDPARLTNALDYRGRICGVTDAVKHRPSAYYMASGAVVCLSSCPGNTDYTQFICYDEYQTEANSNPIKAWTYVSTFQCMFRAKSSKVLNRCVYVEDNVNGTASSYAAKYVSSTLLASIPTQYSSKLSKSSNASGWYYNLFGDIWTLKGYIFGFGLGVSVFFAFFYMYFLRIPGVLSILIWSLISSILILFLVGSVLLYTLAKQWQDDGIKSKTEVLFMFVVSYIGFIVTFLYFCVILILCKRIFLAISIVKEASRAITAMPMLIFMPLVQVLGCVLFLIPWAIFVIYLASSGDVKSKTVGSVTYKSVEYNKNTSYAFLYFLFCWFWTSEFIIAMGQIIIALAVAKWYFTRDKSTCGNADFVWAFSATIRYHLGTAAHGSLIIAIIKTIRAIVAYFQKHAQNTHNVILQWVLCCVQCCLWCLEKCMKFINKNAYIQTAIHGYSFCKAARAAFFLILRNILRVSAVGMVSEFVLLLGKLFVPLATTFLCYLIIAYQLPSGYETGIVAPLILTFILAYFVASMFSEVFGMAIETILCCYIADEEMFVPEKRFADGGLKSAIQKHQSATAKEPQVREIKVHPNGKEGDGMM